MPINLTAELRERMSLTVYQNGFGHINERRSIPRLAEDLLIYYRDVPRLIEADSVIVKGLKVTEQSFEFIADKQSFLDRISGKEIILYYSETKEERIVRLLNARGGLIVKEREGKIVVDPIGEIQLPNATGLHFTPTLIWQVVQQTASSLELSYLSAGFSWEADYILLVTGNRFAMQSWATVRNHSGMDIRSAELRLVAGTVNRSFMRTMEFSAAKMPAEQSFADYHLYTYPTTVTVEDQQQKQFQLVSSEDSSYDTIYEVRKGQRHPTIVLKFLNREENELGIPLPAGQVKVLKEENGVTAFIGEDSIPHTAVNEAVELRIGEAFDLTVYSGDINRFVQDGFEYEVMLYEIRNQKDEAAQLLIRHIPNGAIWTVEESSHQWERRDNEIQIQVTVPAKTNQDVKFTIKYDRSADRRN